MIRWHETRGKKKKNNYPGQHVGRGMNIVYRCISRNVVPRYTLSYNTKCLLDLFGKTGRAVNLARKPGNYGRIELWGPEGINEVISRLWQRSKARSIPDNSSNVVLQFAPPRRNWTGRGGEISVPGIFPSFSFLNEEQPEVSRGFIAPVNFSTLRNGGKKIEEQWSNTFFHRITSIRRLCWRSNFFFPCNFERENFYYLLSNASEESFI